MEPISKFSFNTRSFFSNREIKPVGHGIELWRGFFQCACPALGQMLLNVDVSTGVMYKPGPLINLCLEFLGRSGESPSVLAPRKTLTERDRLRLQRFLAGLQITTTYNENSRRFLRVVRRLSMFGASDVTFENTKGGRTTIAEYFKETYNKVLQFPEIPCIEVRPSRSI